jgi:Ser/Thr protein kinase RdoA (MazF antagonist)
MRNMRLVTEHVSSILARGLFDPERRWKVVRVLPAGNGGDYWVDPAGSFWRAISFIGSSRSFETIQNEHHAREVGYAMGVFQRLINDLPIATLADTLEGFHVTPLYLNHFDEVLGNYRTAISKEIDYCIRFINARREWAHVLENAKAGGRLHLKPIHGDPKVNNVLMDSETGLALSMVDLDTVKPGLVHYDIGDCIRSGCNPMGEAADRWEEIRFEVDLCKAVLQGYFSIARDLLTQSDINYLFDAIRLIPFELGLRFLTDHLEGNVYFKTSRPEHNLYRALVQFQLTWSIESQEDAIRAIIRDLI